MTMSDPLGDMLTRIRNGQGRASTIVRSPASKIRANVLEVLQREGYIRGYSARMCAPVSSSSRSSSNTSRASR